MSIEKIYNIETKETIEIPLSDEAIAYLEGVQAKIDAEQTLSNEKEAARQAVLTKLGLSAAEAKLLLS
jgi:uncharacterized protein YhbP (UPF0306 family)